MGRRKPSSEHFPARGTCRKGEEEGGAGPFFMQGPVGRERNMEIPVFSRRVQFSVITDIECSKGRGFAVIACQGFGNFGSHRREQRWCNARKVRGHREGRGFAVISCWGNRGRVATVGNFPVTRNPFSSVG
ncbi:hypothetical protein AMTR_s00044p00205500 [Amborella trichopoda]|uniref:Uncharacterized protein n=1 Tax=Amborella trichopoda TaxID=13333 RepID=U5D477_AMBTC|nr:hypothetical protein AMTR_s00044p00205500 [Amborella trichopoda]